MSARWLLTTLFVSAGTAFAADLTKVPRTIGKEPAYQTKSPRYLLLAFGPDAAERVWLVQDGDTLHVDRNGNGDLTDPGEKIETKKRPDSDPDVDGRSFDVGDITTAGRSHKGLVVNLIPLARMADDIRDLPHGRQLLRADAKAQIVSLSLEVRHPALRGPGVDGRVPILVGPLDLDGMLVFAGTPKEAPVIHADGPLQITFYGGVPTLQIGRETDVILAVGSPGLGKGTLAMLAYDQVIPAALHPTVEITYSPAKAGDAPFTESYEPRDRC